MKFLSKKFISVVTIGVIFTSLAPAAAQVVADSINIKEERGWNYVAEKQGTNITATFHGKWVNYLSGEGWKLIDQRFYRALDGFAMKDAPFEVYLPLNAAGTATFHNNNKWDIFNKKEITDSPLDMNIQALDVNNVPGRAEFGNLMLPGGLAEGVNYVVYPGAYPNGDLIYYIHHGRAPRLEKLIRFINVPVAEPGSGNQVKYSFKIKYNIQPEFSINTGGQIKKWEKDKDESLEDVPEATSTGSSTPASTGSSTPQQSEVGSPIVGDNATTTQADSASLPTGQASSSQAETPATDTPIIEGTSTPPSESATTTPVEPPQQPASTTPAFLLLTVDDEAFSAIAAPVVIPAEAGIQFNNLAINDGHESENSGNGNDDKKNDATSTSDASNSASTSTADSVVAAETATTTATSSLSVSSAETSSTEENSSTTPTSAPDQSSAHQNHENQSDSSQPSSSSGSSEKKSATLKLNNGTSVGVRLPGSDSRGISMKEFKIWDSNSEKDVSGNSLQKIQRIKVEITTTDDGEYILTKFIPVDFFTGAMLPVFTDTTTTFFPDPSVEVTSVDGYARRTTASATFSPMRTGTGDSSDDLGTLIYVRMGCNTLNQYADDIVSMTLFDTSSIGSNSTISSATYSIYGAAKEDRYSQAIVLTSSNPASNTAIVTSDYDNHTTNMNVNYGTASTTITAFTLAAYNDYTVNSTGLSNISKSGITKFGIVISSDFDNIAMNGGTCTFGGANTGGADAEAQSADTAGTSQDPKLAVTYVSAGTVIGFWNFIFNYLGVALAKSI